MYKIKEIYYTLQGEGFYTGRPSVFIRFSGCNLWNGQEKNRKEAICYWCDTDFVGTNGINGGNYSSIEIKEIILNLWPRNQPFKPYVVCTGGEPLLQIDDELIQKIHDAGFEIGLERNAIHRSLSESSVFLYTITKSARLIFVDAILTSR